MRARIVKKPAKDVKKSAHGKKKKPSAPEAGGRRRFDQLLDDAIFGIKGRRKPGE